MEQSLAFDGKCAFAVSLGKEAPVTTGKYTLTKDGTTYTFLNPIAKFLFKLSSKNIEKAHKAWENQH